MLTPTHRVAHNVAGLYRSPDSSSELVSQLVFGAPADVLESAGDFCRVVGEDGYTGWIRERFLSPLDDDPDSATSTIASLFAEVYRLPSPESELLTRLTTGARIVLSRKPAHGGFVPIDIRAAGPGYVHELQISLSYNRWAPLPSPMTSEGREDLLTAIRALQLDRVKATSLLLIGVPYLWGGTTPFGLDCSGLTQLVYKLSGVQLLRDAHQQFADRRFDTVEVEFGLADAELQRSDLLFFSSARGEPERITHVGLALGDGRFLHAAGKGRGTIITGCREREFAATFVGARRLRQTGTLSIEDA